MVTLVTKQAFKFGQTNIIPYAGEVHISEVGEIEVEDNIAQNIVDCQCGFDFSEGNQQAVVDTTSTTTSTTSTTTSTTTTAPDQIGGIQADELGKQENDELGDTQADDLGSQAEGAGSETINLDEARTALEGKNLNELKEMAKAANHPSAEWRTLNKTQLIDYVLEKIK